MKVVSVLRLYVTRLSRKYPLLLISPDCHGGTLCPQTWCHQWHGWHDDVPGQAVIHLVPVVVRLLWPVESSGPPSHCQRPGC